MAERLEFWEASLPKCVTLAYLPDGGLIRLRLTGRGEDKIKLEQILGKEADKLMAILATDILTDADVTLEELVGMRLAENNLTVSTAESCTAGSIAARIGSVPGCSRYFKGAIVAYSNDVKSTTLGVSSDILASHGAVSKETVIAMVKGAMHNLNTDCAIAVSGIAGPGGGNIDKPVGTIWIAAGCGDMIKTFKQSVDRGRKANVDRASNNALLLLLELLELSNFNK